MPDPAPLGVALLDKPPGISSFAALSRVKRACGTRKVGHTGTLDPFASGLLIGLVGKATRAARLFDGLEKGYVARITFGSATNTDDLTGEITGTADPPTRETLEEVFPQFRGEISQTPPAFSAVHVNGRRAYELARRGENVELQQRLVTIHDLEITDVVSDGQLISEAEIAVTCSTGTYIRSLGRDIAQAAGSVAHLRELRRVSIGPFQVEDATATETMEIGSLRPIESVLAGLDAVSVVEVEASTAASVLHGRKLVADDLPAGWADREWTLVCHEGRAIAIGHAEGRRFAYDAVLSTA